MSCKARGAAVPTRTSWSCAWEQDVSCCFSLTELSKMQISVVHLAEAATVKAF